MPVEPVRAVVVRRCLVSGRVQGVYYRGSARARAVSLGLTGHARNLADGRVEVLVCGDEAAVEQFIEWLWVGPDAAEVREVSVECLGLAPEHRPREFSTG